MDMLIGIMNKWVEEMYGIVLWKTRICSAPAKTGLYLGTLPDNPRG
jgi:hypothetical protein